MSRHRNTLLQWAEEGRIPAADLTRAARLAGALPTPADWLRFVDRLLLFAGGVFIAAGVIFFLAYNWQALGRYAKFGLVQACVIAAVAVAWHRGLDRLSGKAALLAATLLLGALLALFGQTYQTGADTYELFANWALLALPWVILARFAPLWLLWVVLINAAVVMYFRTFPGFFDILIDEQALLWILLAVNTLALIVWETAHLLGIEWLRERQEPRLLALASGAAVTVLTLWFIFDSDEVTPVALLVYLLWMGAVYAFYRYRVRDLFMLAMGVLSGIVVITGIMVQSIYNVFDDAGGLLFIALLVIGLSAAGGWWLRQLAAEERT